VVRIEARDSQGTARACLLSPTTAFVIRQARAADAESFVAQRIALYREMGAIPAGDPATELVQAITHAFLDGLANATCFVWLAHSDAGDCIGSVGMHIVPRLPSPQNLFSREGYVAQLFTSREWRRRGVGSALIRTVIVAARQSRLGRVRLHSTADGLALYQGIGFKLRSNDMELFL
jgi:GNAT superfamily N-acetyltransferase